MALLFELWDMQLHQNSAITQRLRSILLNRNVFPSNISSRTPSPHISCPYGLGVQR